MPGRSRQPLRWRKGEAPSCGPRFCSAQEDPLPKEARQGGRVLGAQLGWPLTPCKSSSPSPTPSCMALPARAAFQESHPRSCASVPCDPLRRPDPFHRPCQAHWSPRPKPLVAFLPTDCWAPALPPHLSLGLASGSAGRGAGSASEPPPCSPRSALVCVGEALPFPGGSPAGGSAGEAGPGGTAGLRAGLLRVPLGLQDLQPHLLHIGDLQGI